MKLLAYRSGYHFQVSSVSRVFKRCLRGCFLQLITLFCYCVLSHESNKILDAQPYHVILQWRTCAHSPDRAVSSTGFSQSCKGVWSAPGNIFHATWSSPQTLLCQELPSLLKQPGLLKVHPSPALNAPVIVSAFSQSADECAPAVFYYYEVFV